MIQWNKQPNPIKRSQGDNPIKTVLVAVNAQYIHTNPAVRAIAACCRMAGLDVFIVETTINNSVMSILTELYEQKADVYLFSCYIWNIDLVRRICSDLKTAMGNICIGVAGPQVSFHQEDFMRENPEVDFVLFGEGEEITPEFLICLQKGEDLPDLPGLCRRDGGQIVTSQPAAPVEMDSLPFAYEDLSGLDGRILYYESMRGCPFSCSYCLSGAGEAVRTRSLPMVYQDLQRFLDARVGQVKFVDRTFNAVKKHAFSIWEYLIANDNGVTNFHFELAGELLDDDMLALLEAARPGLFQFEIGVQSVNADTLRAIHRSFDFGKLSKRVKALQACGNIHLHLDLIAGLPHEDLTSFAESFNRVYGLCPEQLQLGFLKVLSGSQMERDAEKYGIAYSLHAPFEVIRTSWLDYGGLCLLHGVAHMVEVYYNSGRFRRIINYLQNQFPDPFTFYRVLWTFYRDCGHDKSPLSKIGYYEILKPFMDKNGIPVNERAKWLCKLDVLRVEKPRKLPSWIDVDMSAGYYRQILDFFSREDAVSRYLPSYVRVEPKRLMRIVHLEVLPFSPDTDDPVTTAVLFDYSNGKSFCLPVAEDGRIG